MLLNCKRRDEGSAALREVRTLLKEMLLKYKRRDEGSAALREVRALLREMLLKYKRGMRVGCSSRGPHPFPLVLWDCPS